MTIEQVFQTLEKQSFADFYNNGGKFDTWITGDRPEVTEAEAMEELSRLIR